jgi:hypothetical protein
VLVFFKRAGVGALILVLCLLLLGLGAEAAVRFQPATPQPAPTEFVSVLADERTFTLFAALNAAGYADENFGEPFHPVREQTRAYLATKTLPDLTRLRAQLQLTHPYVFVEWVLHYGQPPEFARTVTGWHGSAPALFFFGLDGELRHFYRAAEIGALWQQVRPQVEAETARYRAAVGPAIQQVFDYTRLTDTPLGHIIVIPNLLDAHWRGYGPHLDGSAYVIVGPTGERPDLGLVQHEALHSLVGPLVEANLNAVDAAQAERLFAVLRTQVDAHSYGTWEIILEESVINALGARLAEPEWREVALQNDAARGFWLTRPLAEKLKEYERDGGTLVNFMPELIASLNEINPDTLVGAQ